MNNTHKGLDMKNWIFAIAVLSAAMPSHAEEVCNVVVCNKIKRLSLSIWSHVSDSMGKACFSARLAKSDAVAGKELDSETRWYQGSSINPTKRSVTYVESVGQCRKQ